MKTKPNTIEDMIRSMLETARAEFGDEFVAHPKPAILDPFVRAAIRHANLAFAKIHEWKSEVFRGECLCELSTETQLKATLSAFVELATFLEIRIKAVDARTGTPLAIRSARLLITARESAVRELELWISPRASLAPALRSRKQSSTQMLAPLP